MIFYCRADHRDPVAAGKKLLGTTVYSPEYNEFGFIIDIELYGDTIDLYTTISNEEGKRQKYISGTPWPCFHTNELMEARMMLTEREYEHE